MPAKNSKTLFNQRRSSGWPRNTLPFPAANWAGGNGAQAFEYQGALNFIAPGSNGYMQRDWNNATATTAKLTVKSLGQGTGYATFAWVDGDTGAVLWQQGYTLPANVTTIAVPDTQIDAGIARFVVSGMQGQVLLEIYPTFEPVPVTPSGGSDWSNPGAVTDVADGVWRLMTATASTGRYASRQATPTPNSTAGTANVTVELQGGPAGAVVNVRLQQTNAPWGPIGGNGTNVTLNGSGPTISVTLTAPVAAEPFQVVVGDLPQGQPVRVRFVSGSVTPGSGPGPTPPPPGKPTWSRTGIQSYGHANGNGADPSDDWNSAATWTKVQNNTANIFVWHGFMQRRFSAASLARVTATKANKYLLVYFNSGEIGDSAAYMQAEGWDVALPYKSPSQTVQQAIDDPNVLCVAPNQNWGGLHMVMMWKTRWVNRLKLELEAINTAGFDGAFLDVVDPQENTGFVQFFGGGDPINKTITVGGVPRTLVSLAMGAITQAATHIKGINPNFKIIVNNGAHYAQTQFGGTYTAPFLAAVDGVLLEGLHRTENGELRARGYTNWILSHVPSWQAANKIVLSMEKANPLSVIQSTTTDNPPGQNVINENKNFGGYPGIVTFRSPTLGAINTVNLDSSCVGPW